MSRLLFSVASALTVARVILNGFSRGGVAGAAAGLAATACALQRSEGLSG